MFWVFVSRREGNVTTFGVLVNGVVLSRIVFSTCGFGV
jgi:hypothetical protein